MPVFGLLSLEDLVNHTDNVVHFDIAILGATNIFIFLHTFQTKGVLDTVSLPDACST